ncbi:MAG TPA: hypothetical protein VG890_05515 [Puia sp.]|nr:hypothetical protein [Puia sp.]
MNITLIIKTRGALAADEPDGDPYLGLTKQRWGRGRAKIPSRFRGSEKYSLPGSLFQVPGPSLVTPADREFPGFYSGFIRGFAMARPCFPEEVPNKTLKIPGKPEGSLRKPGTVHSSQKQGNFSEFVQSLKCRPGQPTSGNMFKRVDFVTYIE